MAGILKTTHDYWGHPVSMPNSCPVGDCLVNIWASGECEEHGEARQCEDCEQWLAEGEHCADCYDPSESELAGALDRRGLL